MSEATDDIEMEESMKLRMNEREAAEFIGVAPATLRKWRCFGKGPAYAKLGQARSSRVVYDRRELERWIEGATVMTADVA